MKLINEQNFDYNGPELEDSTGPEAANNRNPKFTQQPGFAHLQKTKLFHSSFVAAEQEQNLVIQETSSTDFWLEVSKELSKETICSKETWTIFSQPEDMLFVRCFILVFFNLAQDHIVFTDFDRFHPLLSYLNGFEMGRSR